MFLKSGAIAVLKLVGWVRIKQSLSPRQGGRLLASERFGTLRTGPAVERDLGSVSGSRLSSQLDHLPANLSVGLVCSPDKTLTLEDERIVRGANAKFSC